MMGNNKLDNDACSAQIGYALLEDHLDFKSKPFAYWWKFLTKGTKIHSTTQQKRFEVLWVVLMLRE